MDLNLLTQLEQKYGLQPGLLNAVMMQESGGKADAVSPKGARGWFQFMPETAKQYGVNDPTDFAQSATGAAKYLAQLSSQFGNPEDALRAYNWGPGNLRKYKAGVRTDMPTEAAEYPQKVLARLDSPPDIDLDEPPEFDLPPEIETPALKSEEPKKDWQKDLEEYRGTTILPMAGGMVGATMGGVAGSGAPVVGTVAGAAAGGTLGAMVGYLSAILPHPAPAEEKLKFIAKKFGQEAVMNLAGGVGVNRLVQLLAKTPAEKLAIEQWFRDNGRSGMRPELGAMAGRATEVYRDAEKRMAQDIDEAIGTTLRELNVGGSPTDMGRVFQVAYRDVSNKVNKSHEVLFAPFSHGTTLGSMPTKPTTEVIDLAKKVIQGFKDTGMTEKDAGAALPVVKMMQDLAAGKEVPLATLIAQKRALANTANWDVVAGTVDNSIRKQLSKALDGAIEARLPPNAAGEWRRANSIATRQLGILHDEMITKMATDTKIDPMQVTEFVAKNASPSAVTAYKKALGMMQVRGSITKEQNAYLMDHVRRNWIEQNMNNHTKAADMYQAILGSGKNQESVDAFNAVFNGSPYKAALEETARAAEALRRFKTNIPASAVSSGEYPVAGAVGATAGGGVGAAILVGSVYLSRVVPRALARAAVNNDATLRRQVQLVNSWINNSSTKAQREFAAGQLSNMPATVLKAYMAVEQAGKEDGE